MQLAAQKHRVACGHVAVQLDPEVDLPAHRFPDRGEARHEVLDPGRLAHQVVLVLEEQDLEGAVALVVDGAASGLDHLLGGAGR